MSTRREFLHGALAMPLAASSLGMPADARIIAGPDCLSQESAAGFRSVLARSRGANLVVLCGAKAVDRRLYAEVMNGAWVIWETSPVALADSSRDLYVHYFWPRAILIRAFSHAMPVVRADSEVIAHYRGVPTATRRRIGRGGMIILGSMLGPSLRAEDREARELAAAIFSEIASGGTSRTASTNM